jgi:hypothetical protein
MSGLADPGNKPLSSAKVKPRKTNDSRATVRVLCETDHIGAASHAKADDAVSRQHQSRRVAGALDTPLRRVDGRVGARSRYMSASIIG